MNVFIAGPRAITKLSDSVCDRLHNIVANNITVLVGDANGVDKSIQQYFYTLSYKNVVVYSSGTKSRNNIGEWQVESISVPSNVRGFEFYAEKDKAMATKSDYGFMLWNGESKGTLNNMINLVGMNKKVLVYFTPKNDFISISSMVNLEKLVSFCSDDTKKLYAQLARKNTPIDRQISLFDNLDKSPTAHSS